MEYINTLLWKTGFHKRKISEKTGSYHQFGKYLLLTFVNQNLFYNCSVFNSWPKIFPTVILGKSKKFNQMHKYIWNEDSCKELGKE